MDRRAQESAVAKLESALASIRSADHEGKKVFTKVFAESARQEAEASDQRRKSGTLRGSLDGAIVSIKALFDVAGEVTAAGSKLLRGLPEAKSDAVVVSRLRSAGAVIIGTTQMTEFAFSALGVNPHDEVPGNPADRQRVPGGSSSGAVVSVIDGMAEIAIGSDTGGSIRIPAALSGAVGFKPTAGRIPTHGAFSLSTTLDTVGPISDSVANCAAAYQTLAETSQDELTAASPGSFRLTIARGRLFDGCDETVERSFSDAVKLLRTQDVDVQDGNIDAALNAIAEIDRIGTFPSIEVRVSLRSLGIEDLEEVDPNTRVRIEAGDKVSASDYVRMVRLRNAAVTAFESSLAANEVVVLPTTPIVAPTISSVATPAEFHSKNGSVLRNPRVANLLDCPSISLPLPGDLPTGFMLIGKRGADEGLLRIARCIESMIKLH